MWKETENIKRIKKILENMPNKISPQMKKEQRISYVIGNIPADKNISREQIIKDLDDLS